MRKAFTAIELVVVFVIIAILAVMLIPALEEGRAQAIRTKCVQRMRRIGWGFSMYQAEQKEYWPLARRSVDPWHGHWPDPTASLALLYPSYAPKVYLFCCPATEDLVALEPDGSDFLNCGNFYVPPEGETTRPGDEGKGRPRPPSYFYDGGSPSGHGIPRNASPGRVVYGDECVHHHWKNKQGDEFWVGENNHPSGGNFLFVDKHVEWLEVQWTGPPWEKGQSMPYVANPHLELDPGGLPLGEFRELVDNNVFWDEWDGERPREDADLAGMMWFDGSWKEF